MFIYTKFTLFATTCFKNIFSKKVQYRRNHLKPINIFKMLWGTMPETPWRARVSFPCCLLLKTCCLLFKTISTGLSFTIKFGDLEDLLYSQCSKGEAV